MARILIILFAVYALCVMSLTSAATITVDGNKQDWAGIPSLLSDPAGDVIFPNTPDFLELKVTNDRTNIFFLYQFADSPRLGDSFLGIDIEGLAENGCPGLEDDFVLAFVRQTQSGFLGKVRNCGFRRNDFPGALLAAFGESFIEASLPINVFQEFVPDFDVFNIAARNDRSLFAEYKLEAHGIPLPDSFSILMVGLLALWITRWVRDKQEAIKLMMEKTST